MAETTWLGTGLPLLGAAATCLALLLPPRCELAGSPLGRPHWDGGRACILLLLFTALVVASARVDPAGEWAPLRVALDFGGTAGLLLLALLPAARGGRAGWGRAGFAGLPAFAAPWLATLMAGVSLFHLVLLRYVPCQPCVDLEAGAMGWARVAASATFMGLLAPLTEEVLFRGIALPLAVARLGRWGGILVSAASWALVHGEASVIPLLVLGLALAWLTLATGSLWAALGFHVAWNIAAVAHGIGHPAAGAGERQAVPTWIIFVAVAGLLLGWARLRDLTRGQGLRTAPRGRQGTGRTPGTGTGVSGRGRGGPRRPCAPWGTRRFPGG